MPKFKPFFEVQPKKSGSYLTKDEYGNIIELDYDADKREFFGLKRVGAIGEGTWTEYREVRVVYWAKMPKHSKKDFKRRVSTFHEDYCKFHGYDDDD